MQWLFDYDSQLLHFLEYLLANVIHDVTNNLSHYLFQVLRRRLDLNLLKQAKQTLALETCKLVPIVQEDLGIIIVNLHDLRYFDHV